MLSPLIPLDSFDMMFSEANDSVVRNTVYNRISIHVQIEIMRDVVPTLAYNTITGRFVSHSHYFPNVHSLCLLLWVTPSSNSNSFLVARSTIKHFHFYSLGASP